MGRLISEAERPFPPSAAAEELAVLAQNERMEVARCDRDDACAESHRKEHRVRSADGVAPLLAVAEMANECVTLLVQLIVLTATCTLRRALVPPRKESATLSERAGLISDSFDDEEDDSQVV